MTDLEQRLERANAQYHKCLGGVVMRFVDKNERFADVTEQCIEERRRVNTLMKELEDNYKIFVHKRMTEE